MFQEPLKQKIRFLAQKMCPLARGQKNKQKKPGKMPQTTSIFKISKNKKMRFFLMFQEPIKPKIRFLTQKMCPVARGQTHRQTRK